MNREELFETRKQAARYQRAITRTKRQELWAEHAWLLSDIPLMQRQGAPTMAYETRLDELCKELAHDGHH